MYQPPTELPFLADALGRHSIDPDLVAVQLAPVVVVTCRGSEVSSLDGLRAAATGRRPWRPPAVVTSPLTARETAVAELVAAGRRTSEIAATLGLSVRTVTTARQSLRSKAVVVTDEHAAEMRVIGAPSVLRDVVHDCLHHAGLPLARLGSTGPTTGIAILVEPSARELAGTGDCRVVVLGRVPSSIGLVSAIQRGLVAVLDVTATPEELLAAVEGARDGEPRFTQGVIKRLVEELWQPSGRATALTERERAVLDGVVRLESVKQTARRLGLSSKTVENHRQQAYRKLGVRSAHEARVRYSAMVDSSSPAPDR